MGKHPKFSVVLPTYNRGHVLKKAIDSVLEQSFQDFELIIVDDGSIDNTKEIIAGINDARIICLYQDNGGGSKARNTGINAATGEYIAFLDSDDLFIANKLERVFKIIANIEADVYFSYAIVDRGNEITALKPSRPIENNEPIDEFLFCSCETIQTSTMIVRSSVAKKVKFNEGLKKGQDIDFSIRLFSNRAKFFFIDEPLSIWTDKTSQNRVSHVNCGSDLESWLIYSKEKISSRAYYGFRANILSYEIAATQPIRTIIDLLNGFFFGGTSINRTFHSAARAFMPRRIYRHLVDIVLKANNTFAVGKTLIIVFFSFVFLVPTTAFAYKGRNLDADWREKAEQRIESYRKADLTIKVLNDEGKKMEGVKVHVKMKKHAFAFGAAVGARMLTKNDEESERYRALVLNQYNKVVLENDLKWDPWNASKTSPLGSKYYLPQTFAALQWLKNNDIAVRGHYISWGPIEKFQTYKKYKSNPEKFYQLLFAHIKDKMSAVNNLVDEWDAINHPIAWNDKLINLDDLFGKNIYLDILKSARKINPNVKLYVNDGGILPNGNGKFNQKKRDKYENFIRYLIDNDAPLDGIGFMSHFTPKRLTAPTDLYRIVERFASFRLPLQVTEFDIRFAKPKEIYNFSEEELRLQADYTRDFMTVMFSHPAVVGIVMWGFWEGHLYQPSASLYRPDWTIKPNGEAWNNLVFKKWWTDVNGTTDKNGIFQNRGFLGDYEIVAEKNGESLTKLIKLTKDGINFNIFLYQKKRK